MARPAPTRPNLDDDLDREDDQSAAEDRETASRDEPAHRQREPAAEPAATTAQLKEDIDRGRSGAKVAAPDPAAAPLGTDDEAAGASPTDGSVRVAYRDEVAKAPRKTGSQNQHDIGSILYLVALALFAAALSAAVVLVFF